MDNKQINVKITTDNRVVVPFKNVQDKMTNNECLTRANEERDLINNLG